MATSLLAIAALCPAQVVINEFMAINNGAYTNNLGETSDWIELYNTTSTDINLTGWHLTDDAAALSRWTFPATNIPGYGYLLVFADGSNSPSIKGFLHANFKLDGNGEYLGLIRPNGTIASEYSDYEYKPGLWGFCPQRNNIAYGMNIVDEEILPGGSDCRFYAPTNDSGLSGWYLPDFDDSSWTNIETGVGYEYGSGLDPYISTDVRELMPTNQHAALVRMAFDVADASAVETVTLNIRCDDGFVAYLNGYKIAESNAPPGAQWDSAATAEQSDTEATNKASFLIQYGESLLVSGTNVLAVLGLAYPETGPEPDFLIRPELRDKWSKRSFLSVLTPGSSNATGYAVDPVLVSPGRGFYPSNTVLNVTLSCGTGGSEIRYTRNSKVPTATDTLYTNSIAVSNTTVLRARAFRTGYQPTEVVTHSYIFPSDVASQPTMSLAITQDTNYGPLMVSSLLSEPTISIAMPDGITIGVEHAASVEFMVPDGSEPGFVIGAGMKPTGSTSIGYPKQSLRMYYRARYGAGKLKYPIFKDHPYGDQGVDEYDQLSLRCGHDSTMWLQSHAQYIRSIWIDDMQLAMGDVGLHGRMTHVYLNGVYWGHYHIRERPTEAFMSSYVGGVDEDYTVQQDYLANPLGNPVWSNIVNYTAASNFPAAKTYLDESHLINYMLLNFYSANTKDWSVRQNWIAAGDVATNRSGWKFFSWDSDVILWSSGGVGAYAYGNNLGSGVPEYVFDRMRGDPDFRILLSDRIYKHFFHDGMLTSNKTWLVYSNRASQAYSPMVAESARWQNGALWTRAMWETERNFLRDSFFPVRTGVMIGQFRAAGWYPLDAPEFSVPPGTFTGSVMVAISVTNGAPVYYTVDGSDPRAWGSGASVGTPYSGPITLTRATVLKARALQGGQWSALNEGSYIPVEPSPLRVTELMFHPRNPAAGQTNWTEQDFEFIELQNPGAGAVGLTGVKFTEGISFDFTYSAVTTLAPSAYMVVVKNRAAFTNRYANWPSLNIAGEFQRVQNWPVQTFADNGERVRLVDGLDRELVDFTYGDGRGWPLAADGAGHSLVPRVLTDQTGLLDYGGNWRASAYLDGSPGAADPAPPTGAVLNEIMAHTDYLSELDSDDWIELFNPTAAPVNLTDWYLSDDPADLRQWRIPATNTIAAGGWVTFDEVTGFHFPTNTGFGLNKDGEQVFLSYLPGDTNDRVADAVRFKAQENFISLGRYRDGAPWWQALAPITPNAANAAPVPRVAIAELMYHPAAAGSNATDNTDDEYVELVNPTTNAVVLMGEPGAGAWRLDGAVRYTFPSNTVLAAEARVALVSFNPQTNAVVRNAFLLRYGLTNGQVRLLGPWSGQLGNHVERLALEQPQLPDVLGAPVAWVIVDEVIYFDREPWPMGADGTGNPLRRISPAGSGNDPQNWFVGASATPGQADGAVELVAPAPGTARFTPAQVALRAIVHPAEAVGVVQEVAFYEGTNRLGAAVAEPYAAVAEFDRAGFYQIRAELRDDEGVKPSLPAMIAIMALTNLPADGITDIGATVHGRLEAGPAEVGVYWGPDNGGTTAAAWAHWTPVGSVNNAAFAATLGPLEAAGWRYYYRASAQRGLETGWAGDSASFLSTPYTSWARHLQLQVTGYTEAETVRDFPLLVVLGTNVPGFSYADFGASWYSLRFTDGQGRRLPYEVQRWDTNGNSTIWVKLLELTNNAVLHAWWGNPVVTQAAVCAGGPAVWGADHEGVWHLEPDLAEAAGHYPPALNTGSTAVAGAVLQGRGFDGLSAAVDPGWSGAAFANNRDHLTLSLWVKPVAAVDKATPLGCETIPGGPTSKRALYLRMNTFSRTPNWIWGIHTNEWLFDSYATGQWQLVTLVLSNGTAYGSVNDRVRMLLGSVADLQLPTLPVLGRRSGSGTTNAFSGLIDELRLASVARSAAWVRAAYRTVMQAGSFLAYGAVEPGDGGDANDNGLPDIWERQAFGEAGGTNAAPEADWDGDGMRNDAEYVAGTDPTNAASVFRLDIAQTNGRSVVGFAALPAQGVGYAGQSRFYDLLGASNLFTPGWLPLPGYSNLPGSSGYVSYTNSPADRGLYYYRGGTRLE